ncbi:MAG: hypothetical protein JNM17_28090 [Archangium sp.]|nr:hypothetical protein [Archangium sp.]
MLRALLLVPLVWSLGSFSPATESSVGGGTGPGDAGTMATVVRRVTETFSFDFECRVYRLTVVEHCTRGADGGEQCVIVETRRDDFKVPCDQLDRYREPRVTQTFL